MKTSQLHSKDKGTLGQISVAKDLMRKGLPVFSELGDNSKVDIITIYKDHAIKIQVKSYKRSKDGRSFTVYATKSGPNYSFRYKETDFDIFAVYLYELDEIYYVPLKDVLATESGQIVIRLKKARNGQTKRIRVASQYRSLSKAIKNAFDISKKEYRLRHLRLVA